MCPIDLAPRRQPSSVTDFRRRPQMKSEMRLKVPVAVVALLMSVLTARAISDAPLGSLAAPESFAAIQDTAARSAAVFIELGKVLTNPRCVNCHPAGDRPHQGELGRLHQ